MIEMIRMKSKDGKIVEAPKEAMRLSLLVTVLLEEQEREERVPGQEKEPIPILHVNGDILTKVVDWCIHHKDDPPPVGPVYGNTMPQQEPPQIEIGPWDQNYYNVDQAILCELIQAANHLNIEGLFDMSCKAVANLIKGKSVEELRDLFNLKNDFTPEEEALMRRQHPNAFKYLPE